MLVRHIIYISSSHNVGFFKITDLANYSNRNLVMTDAQSSLPNYEEKCTGAVGVFFSLYEKARFYLGCYTFN